MGREFSSFDGLLAQHITWMIWAAIIVTSCSLCAALGLIIGKGDEPVERALIAIAATIAHGCIGCFWLVTTKRSRAWEKGFGIVFCSTLSLVAALASGLLSFLPDFTSFLQASICCYHMDVF